jgi:hypothetical protein
MKCQQCGHTNPDNNRFCGMCGGKVEARPAAPAPDFTAVPRNGEGRLESPTPQYRVENGTKSAVTADRIALDQQREIVRDRAAQNPVSDSRRATTSAAAARALSLTTPEEEAEEERPTARNINYSTGIGGPSFLGIGYDSGASNGGFVYDKPRNDGFVYDTDGEAPEYLLDEQPGRTVSWRAWALFAILLVGGALAYIQWKASRHEGPDLASILDRNGAATTAEKSLPGAVDPSKQEPPAKTAPGADAAKPNSDDTDATAAAPTAATDAKKNDEKNVAGDKTDSAVPESKASKPDKDETASASKNTDDSDMSAAADSKASNEASSESDEPVSKATKGARKPAPVEEDASADESRPSRAASRPPAAKPLGDKDPLIVQAESYIQGRGVRQNCSQGVNLLRQAVGMGNPAADVKLGALYWTGTCVTQSKVTAYQWFSRAHEKEPRNVWIERSRNSLWASMSSQEKQRVGY